MSTQPEPAPISISERSLLAALAEVGNSAALDQFGRLVVGTRFLPGNAAQWLKLAAMGAIAGERDRIILTELGRAAAATS